MAETNILSILIIDDEESIRKYVQDTLADEGYKAVVANDGASGLNMVQIYRPDLILLDMYMPAMDGWAFLAAYAQMQIPHAPIIAMSSEIDVKRMPGVVAGIGKPFTIDRLLVAVKKVLPLSSEKTSSV